MTQIRIYINYTHIYTYLYMYIDTIRINDHLSIYVYTLKYIYIYISINEASLDSVNGLPPEWHQLMSIFFYENCPILIQFLIIFPRNFQYTRNQNPSLFQTMVSFRPSETPLSELTMVYFTDTAVHELA